MSQSIQAVNAVKTKQSKFSNNMNTIIKQRWLLAMVIPGVIFMIVFNFYPMWFAQIGFRDYYITYGTDLFKAPWVGMDYIKQFFNSPDFSQVMLDTLGISLLKLLFGFPIPIMFAIMLNELTNLKFKKIVQSITYLPHFLSWVIVGCMMMVWMSDTGFLTKLCYNLHIINQQSNMLASSQNFWTISVVSEIWKEFGWNSIIFLAAIVSIDQEMFEAARIDGAGKLRQIIDITLPSIAPTISLMLVLSISGLFSSNFDQIFVLQNAVNRSASNVIDVYVYQQAFTGSQYSYATAVGLFKSIVSAILLISANQVTKKINDYSLF
jgi:putative aldouronate transport system permease protein